MPSGPMILPNLVEVEFGNFPMEIVEGLGTVTFMYRTAEFEFLVEFFIVLDLKSLDYCVRPWWRDI